MTEADNERVAMEEQAMDDAKNPGQQESAYGSLESSSHGQSQKSSYSGSKSLNSGSSHHSSGFGDNGDFSENHLKETKHKDHKRKKAKEKTEKLLLKDKTEKFVKVEEKDKAKEKKRGSPSDVHDARHISETASSSAMGLEESASTFNGHSHDGDDRACDQPTLVYTQALNYIRKIKERSAEQGVPFASPELVQLPRHTHDAAAFLKTFKSTRGFTVAISVQDGTVLQVSPAITDVLGFPKDMLVGQSFINFVYPKDSINLSSKIIHGLNMPFRSDSIKDNYGTSFFCRLRMYHGLKAMGFGVRNKRTYYKPCKMVLKFQDTQGMEETASTYGPNSSLLLAEVIPIESVYKVPGETPAMGSFSIRHSASCNFSEYDPEAIPYLGHLPQDLTGNSIFDCYHPEDLPMLKSVYEEMVKEQGKPHRSKPYRFRTFSGSYVTLETEWLCFVNPWTKKIDSIIGQHRVLKGPNNVEIFLDPVEKAQTPFTEEVLKEAKKAQADIIELLSQPVASYRDPSKEPQEMRRRTLAHMMSSIVEELDHMEKRSGKTVGNSRGDISHHNQSRQTNLIPESGGHHSTFKPASVVMGEISPHQDDRCYDNPSSSTPSSYSKLNYNETLQRFFRSHPKTVSSDESGDSKMEVSHVGSLDGKSSSHPEFSLSGGSGGKHHKNSQSHSQSCSGSGDNCDNTRKSESTGNCSGGSGETGQTWSLEREYHHVQLTEEVLSRHNLDMQKMFMQKQRNSGGKYREKWKMKSLKKSMKRVGDRSHGVKRPSAVLDQEVTVQKQPFLAPTAGDTPDGGRKPPSAEAWPRRETINPPASPCGPGTGPGMPTASPAAAAAAAGRLAAPPFPGIMSGFYLPTSSANMSPVPNDNSNMSSIPQPPPGPTLMMPQQTPTAYIQPQASVAVPVQYMGAAAFPGVMYQPVGPPLFNAPPLMLPNMVFQHTIIQSPLTPHISIPLTSDTEKQHRSGAESEQELLDANIQSKSFTIKRSAAHMRRPDSQATSVKAEPGSARGSSASVSGKIISSHSHAAESIRSSYLEDATILSPGCAPKVSQFSQSTSVLAEAESLGSPGKQDKMAVVDERDQRLHENSSDMVMSVSSSTNSSSREYKYTDDSIQNLSENSENSEFERMGMRWNVPRSKCRRPVLSDPPWLENVKVTPELLYKYQLETKELVDVLKKDMDMLKQLRQPAWVDDQLSSLYHEMELDGSSPDLHLEDGITSSSGEEQAGTSTQTSLKKKRRASYFSKMAMLHEEDAPIPSPYSSLLTQHPGPESSSNSSS